MSNNIGGMAQLQAQQLAQARGGASAGQGGASAEQIEQQRRKQEYVSPPPLPDSLAPVLSLFLATHVIIPTPTARQHSARATQRGPFTRGTRRLTESVVRYA